MHTENHFFFQVQVFLNQVYKTPVEKRLDRNPDLLAIRFASTNPILDPWIYILLRKAVLSKLIENLRCLFCRSQHVSRDSPCAGELKELTEALPDTCQSNLCLSEAPPQCSDRSSLDSRSKEPSLQMTITNEAFQEKSI